MHGVATPGYVLAAIFSRCESFSIVHMPAFDGGARNEPPLVASVVEPSTGLTASNTTPFTAKLADMTRRGSFE
jgi:hypothetical protein